MVKLYFLKACYRFCTKGCRCWKPSKCYPIPFATSICANNNKSRGHDVQVRFSVVVKVDEGLLLSKHTCWRETRLVTKSWKGLLALNLCLDHTNNWTDFTFKKTKHFKLWETARFFMLCSFRKLEKSLGLMCWYCKS